MLADVAAAFAPEHREVGACVGHIGEEVADARARAQVDHPRERVEDLLGLSGQRGLERQDHVDPAAFGKSARTSVGHRGLESETAARVAPLPGRVPDVTSATRRPWARAAATAASQPGVSSPITRTLSPEPALASRSRAYVATA